MSQSKSLSSLAPPPTPPTPPPHESSSPGAFSYKRGSSGNKRSSQLKSRGRRKKKPPISPSSSSSPSFPPQSTSLSGTSQTDSSASDGREEMIKQLASVVCICKGITLSRFLPALKTSGTIAEVHQCVGSGDGGCQGRRCSPRVATLIDKSQGLRSAAAKEAQ